MISRTISRRALAKTLVASGVGAGLPRWSSAEVLARGLKIPAVSLSPEEAQAHFGWMAMFAGADMPASSALTQQWLDWHPTGSGLIADLEQMRYF